MVQNATIAEEIEVRALSWFQHDKQHSFIKDWVTLKALIGEGAQARTARTFVCLAVLGALCFASLIAGIESGWSTGPTPIFLAVFAAAALFQVCVLIVVAHTIVGTLWRWGIDPDNAAIPIITSIGDVMGTSALTCVFCALFYFGSEAWTGSGL